MIAPVKLHPDTIKQMKQEQRYAYQSKEIIEFYSEKNEDLKKRSKEKSTFITLTHFANN